MDDVSAWFGGMTAAGTEMQSQIVAYLPNLLGALLLLAVGWGIARLARTGTRKLSGGLGRLLERGIRFGRLSRLRLSPRIHGLLASIVFWLVMLLFITAATRVARLDAFSLWLDRIVAYLPTLIAGGLIVLFGYLISAMVRDLLSATFVTAGLGRGELVGSLSQATIIAVSVIIGIDQVGIDVTFLVTMAAIIVAAILGGVSLAFGLGARSFVSNLIGAHYLQQQLQPGQRARIGEAEGEVLELTPTSVVLATPDGRLLVPAKLFHEMTTTLVLGQKDDE